MKRFFKFLVIHLIIHILLHLLGFSFYEILLLSLFLVVVDEVFGMTKEEKNENN